MAAESTLHRKRIGQILLETGFVQQEQLDHALLIQQETGARLGTLLVRLRNITDAVLHSVLEQQLGVPFVDLERENVDPKLTAAITRDGILRFEMLPLRIDEEGSLQLAMLDPHNSAAIEEARSRLKVENVVVRLLDDRAFQEFVETHAQNRPLLQRIISEPDDKHPALRVRPAESSQITRPLPQQEVDALRNGLASRPAIALIGYILREAVSRKASDVHIDPYPSFTRVRLRIDGVLQTVLTPPARLHAFLVARIKDMFGLAIEERRQQEAHRSLTVDGKSLQASVCCIESGRGEKCTLRLDISRKLIPFEQLSFSDTQRQDLYQALGSIRGLILAVGPSSCGKTATARSLLAHLTDPSLNVLSLETELLSEIDGVAQIPMSSFKFGARAGDARTSQYAEGLRTLLRQDPDVLFISELKEPEVAQVALQAASRGNLLVSTLNAFDAAAALHELAGFGVDPHRIANTVLAVIAQRLLRKVCRKCKVEARPDLEELEALGLRSEDIAEAQLMTGAGCSRCRKVGYSGMLPIFEVLRVGRSLSRLIVEGAAEEAILAEARERNGFRSMHDDGISKALRGLTSLSEVRRVAPGKE